jgi:predicted DCC family thiol-disulfide oxidoreductase YuxK
MVPAAVSPDPSIVRGSDGRHLLLYDGVCGLCNWLVEFVLHRDRHGLFHFAALQSAAGRAAVERAGGVPGALTTFLVVTDYRTPASASLTRGRAAVFVIASLGGPWHAAALLNALPAAWLDFLYDLIARHRYRLFGRDDVCRVPPRDYRHRFVE